MPLRTGSPAGTHGHLSRLHPRLQSEYIAERDSRLGWLTGFTGSAGEIILAALESLLGGDPAPVCLLVLILGVPQGRAWSCSTQEVRPGIPGGPCRLPGGGGEVTPEPPLLSQAPQW